LDKAKDNFKLVAAASSDLKSGLHFGMTEDQKRETHEKASKGPVYPGEEAFRLYDTYGLPMDFILDAARDLGIKLDEAGFESAMKEQKTRARASWKGGAKEAANPVYAKLAETFKTEPWLLLWHDSERFSHRGDCHEEPCGE